MTDGHQAYPRIGAAFAAHSSVDHKAGEYVREGVHHSNTVENHFSILKRGIIGTYHYVNEAHLHRYLSEFVSATRTARAWASQTPCAPTKCSMAPPASA